MSEAEQYPAGEQPNVPTGSRWLNRDDQSPDEGWKRDLLSRLARQAAGLRANAVLLGDRIEHLARLAAERRAG